MQREGDAEQSGAGLPVPEFPGTRIAASARARAASNTCSIRARRVSRRRFVSADATACADARESRQPRRSSAQTSSMLSRAVEKCGSFGSRKEHRLGCVTVRRGEVVSAGQAGSRSDGPWAAGATSWPSSSCVSSTAASSSTTAPTSIAAASGVAARRIRPPTRLRWRHTRAAPPDRTDVRHARSTRGRSPHRSHPPG